MLDASESSDTGLRAGLLSFGVQVTMQRLAAAESPRGEIVLGRVTGGHLELRVNGVFAMDTRSTTTEEALADRTLSALPTARSVRVLVGGLGLGFTARRVLASTAVERLLVVEIEPDLVAWHRAGLVPGGPALLTDPRVEVVIGDVRDVVRRLPPASVDAVILDVDNGPANLVYDANAAVYGKEFLSACRRVLTAAGALAVWSADPSGALETRLATEFGSVEHHRIPVRLGDRAEHFSIYLALVASESRAAAPSRGPAPRRTVET